MKAQGQMRKGILLTAGLTFGLYLLGGTGAYAEPVAGDREIQVAAGIFKAQDSDSGNVAADVSYGYYLDRNWQIGLSQGLNYTFIDGADDLWTATSVPFLNYHFYGLSKDDRVVPFVGGFVGAIWNDQDITGTGGPNVGAKFFFNDQTFMALRYRYEFFFDELDAADDTLDEGNHVGTVGLGFTWGGEKRETARLSRMQAVTRVDNAAVRSDQAAARAEGAAARTEAAAERIEQTAEKVQQRLQHRR